MRILVYENSSGFSPYTYKVCNDIYEEYGEDVSITYLTSKENRVLQKLDKRVRVLPILKEYDNSKKKSIKWLFNRIFVSIYCILIRNRHCKREKYDVISVQSTISVFDQYFISRLVKNNPNVAYTVHDVIPPTKSFFWSRKSLKKIYDTVPKLIVHTEGNKKQLINEFNIPEYKIHVVHHGTDINYIKFDKKICKERFGLSKEKIIILFYGMIREQKGLEVLLNALKGIEGVQLLIAGNIPFGESFDKYSELIRENDLDVIEYIEYIPDEWTDEIYQACDIVCLPYKYFYSQSGVFMQAIKYRRPVIVSDVSSFNEYIGKYRMGVLCKPNDCNDLHNKILEVKTKIEQDSKYYFDGLETAANENSWLESAIKYMKVFSE